MGRGIRIQQAFKLNLVTLQMSQKALPSSFLGNNIPTYNFAYISLECFWEFIPCGICHPQATHLVEAGCRHLLLSHLLFGGRELRWIFCEQSTGTAPLRLCCCSRQDPRCRQGRGRDGLGHAVSAWHRAQAAAQAAPLMAVIMESRDGSKLQARQWWRWWGCWLHSAAALLAAGWMFKSLSCLGNYRARTWQSRQHETKLVHKFTGQGLMNSWSPRRVPVP